MQVELMGVHPHQACQKIQASMGQRLVLLVGFKRRYDFSICVWQRLIRISLQQQEKRGFRLSSHEQ
jgi:hypothetical protein